MAAKPEKSLLGLLLPAELTEGELLLSPLGAIIDATALFTPLLEVATEFTRPSATPRRVSATKHQGKFLLV